MIRCKRRVIRETSEIHGPTRKPFVVRINEGGRTVSIKIKGRRTWFTVTIRQLWTMGAADGLSKAKLRYRIACPVCKYEFCKLRTRKEALAELFLYRCKRCSHQPSPQGE